MRCWMGVCVFGMVAWETVGLGIRPVKDDGSGDGIRAGARGMRTEKGRGVGIKWEMACYGRGDGIWDRMKGWGQMSER